MVVDYKIVVGNQEEVEATVSKLREDGYSFVGGATFSGGAYIQAMEKTVYGSSRKVELPKTAEQDINVIEQ